MRFALGSSVKDKVTGFIGVATGYVQYITGCNQYLVQPAVKADGEFVEGRWVDEQRLEAAEGAVIELENAAAPGPDMPPPIR